MADPDGVVEGWTVDQALVQPSAHLLQVAARKTTGGLECLYLYIGTVSMLRLMAFQEFRQNFNPGPSDSAV